jgi:hypothetical protein
MNQKITRGKKYEKKISERFINLIDLYELSIIKNKNNIKEGKFISINFDSIFLKKI